MNRGRHIEIRGIVQGVGFRPWVHQVAQRSGIAGSVRNDSSGVIIDAFGDDCAMDVFLRALDEGAPPAARVRSIESQTIPFRTVTGFTIEESAVSAEHHVSIPADLATCDDCLREILDSTNRRYRYPFTNCTNCGPRYSIVTGAPYDRPMTSMVTFEMCAGCRREYDDPLDRRFHAQPNACPKCGPALVAVSAQGAEVSTNDAIRFAARALRGGMIVAIKGIGGFHLACDARSAGSVARLRERKHREARPLAVMVADLAQADTLAVLTDRERQLLTSVERPIVLARLRVHSPLASNVCANDSIVGLFLPYTPLHHLLLRDAGIPLVMTSGNVSDEPMATANADALEHLRSIADVFLIHDRDIVTRVDDSVVRVIDDAPVILRRSRGYVPRAIEAKTEFAEPLLGCGAHLKNTFCIGFRESAFLGPHIGDLDTVDTVRDYDRAIAQMKKFVGAEPRILAHDLHPDYFSTRYARSQDCARAIPVQHHHAHIASAMAEHGLDETVIGVAYDGTGLGTDGTSWGGEILIASYEGFTRFATFRAMPLAGGDQAIRQPWRLALALLDDAFDENPPLAAIPLFRSIDSTTIAAVRRAIATGLNAPAARGAGRYFDAFGALVLGSRESRYEGDVAFQWNLAADENERGRYPILIHEASSPWEIDFRPTLRAAVVDLLAGRAPATISARFHNTIAAATVDVVRAAARMLGEMPVVLSGGCFQNARLSASISEPLRATTDVFMNRDVPPGDGGIALGQVFIANAVLKRGAAAAMQEEVAVCA